jgi:hypothetical protein
MLNQFSRTQLLFGKEAMEKLAENRHERAETYSESNPGGRWRVFRN